MDLLCFIMFLLLFDVSPACGQNAKNIIKQSKSIDFDPPTQWINGVFSKISYKNLWKINDNHLQIIFNKLRGF